MTYYKITHKETGDIYFGSCELPIKAEKLCEVLGLDDYTAEVVTEEEYERQTVDTEGSAE